MISQGIIYSSNEVQRSIISKSWSKRGTKATDIFIFMNNILDIRITIYEFFIIACLFVPHKVSGCRHMLGPGINAARQKAN